ncbi:dihydroorotase [Flaviaesturariibacter flavus]|uniref:Dihydroorotase n=1 Tax=Flaviaesturariibacter flavus TaxID=2502780 RepID=A0A4R1BPU4_9BACT|nr:dihydroorotase [Flaviaesturariibacter flavus]TCJ19286.1 dihydroorotase [Flaviaesturariibacter flavus]
MNLLLRRATIVDPASHLHGQIADIAIRDGIIHQIATGIDPAGYEVTDADGLCASPGFVDLFAQFCDPGEEHRESLQSGAAAAAAGGYTDVLLVPNTNPCVYNKSTVEYIRRSGENGPVNLHPIGALTRNTEGKELAELYDMAASGAKAFSDGLKPIQSGGLLLKALQYILAIDGVIIQLPDDRSFNPGGLMHEGVVSTRLGLPGRPALAEELMVARDIELLRYTGARLHLTGISCAGSVSRIRAAKAEGLRVTCSVTPLHLLFTDDDLAGYDTNLKLAPPLRTAADREALRAAVIDGTVDCIASHHLPQDSDHKVVEFEYAANGALGLQTAYAAVAKAMPELAPDMLAALFGANARRIFGLDDATIREGSPATITLHAPQTPWTFTETQNRSRSANSPFFGKAFTARIGGIIHRGGLFLNTF